MGERTLTSNLPPAVQAFYEKRFLLRAKEQLAFHQFGQKAEVPEKFVMPANKGKTVYFTRYVNRSARTTALTEDSDTGGITPSNLSSEEINATVALYGDYVKVTHFADLTAIDDQKNEKTDLMSDQMALSVDTLIRNVVCARLNRIRADNSATYTVSGTATSGSTTTLADTTNLTQADNFWVGGFMVITGGANYGEVRLVSAFANATGLLTTTTAFSVACDTTTTYRVIVGTGLTAANVINSTNVRLAKREIRRNKGYFFDGKYLVGILDSDSEYDFTGDQLFKDTSLYKDQVSYLFDGEIGKFLGVRWIMGTNPYRETVAGVASSTGVVDVVPIFGQHCYGVVNLERQPEKLYIKTPDQLGQPMPFYSTMGWMVGMTTRVLNGLFGVGLMVGTTE